MSKWNYYGFKETGKVWKQKKAITENPSTKYHLYILTKEDYKQLLNSKTSKMAKDKKKKKDSTKKSSSNSKEGQRKFSGSIALSKLVHVRMKKKNKKGKKIDCLVIPIKENFLVEGKEGAVYMPISVITKTEEDQYGQHGFIGQNADSKTYKDASEKEKEKIGKLPILGNIKDFEFNQSSSNDTAGSKGQVEEDDDLPF